jgi:NurA-like 5'-3' nuclease
MDNAERIRLQKNILMRINKQHSRLLSKWEKLDERINEYVEDLDEEYDAIESITDLNLKGSIEVKNYQQDLENKLSKIEEKLKELTMDKNVMESRIQRIIQQEHN